MVVPGMIDGKTVVSIWDDFICMNSAVKEVVLPNTAEKIGKSAFNSCTSLTRLHLPAAVNCSSLTDFTCAGDNSNFTIQNGILYDREMHKIIAGPDSATSLREYAFYDCRKLASNFISAFVVSFGSDVVSNTGKVVILCDEGSAAEAYA